MFESEKEDRISKPDRMKQIGVCISIAGLFLNGFFGLVQNRSFFSPWQVWFFGYILPVVIVLILGYGLVWPWIYNVACRIMKNRKENALARQLNTTFSMLLRRFGDIASDSKYNAIRSALKEIRNKNMQLVSVCDDNSFDRSFSTFTEFYYKSNLKTKYEFILFLKWFETVLAAFNDSVICNPVSLARSLSNLDLPVDTLEAYENARAAYNEYIRNYCDFAKEVKAKFGDVCLQDWFYPPKQLFPQSNSVKKN